jgi:formylglycine-generating enzyme required for sulfatase activity
MSVKPSHQKCQTEPFAKLRFARWIIYKSEYSEKGKQVKSLCPACGVRIADDAVQCSACGHVLKLRSNRDANGADDKAKVIRDYPQTSEMVVIPAGEFVMGGKKYNHELPHHRVKVSQFAIGSTPVTQSQWQAVMGNNPSRFQGEGTANCPVECVSWDDVQEYIDKLNILTCMKYRLPSEAEWEYACRAGSTGMWCFGDDEAQLTHYAWYDENSDKKTHPVGQKRANAFNLYDMHGNVLEWVQDCWNYTYEGAPTDGSAWTMGDCEMRVLRGGSWFELAFHTRSASRIWYDTADRESSFGFRLAKTLP